MAHEWNVGPGVSGWRQEGDSSSNAVLRKLCLHLVSDAARTCSRLGEPSPCRPSRIHFSAPGRNIPADLGRVSRSQGMRDTFPFTQQGRFQAALKCSPNAGEFSRVPRLLSQVNLLDGVVACLGASAVLQGLDRSEESEVQNVGVRAVRYHLYAMSIQGARCQQLDIIEHTVRACVVLHYAAAVTVRPGSW